MSERHPFTQLQMVWPADQMTAPPPVRLAPGYTLRTYRPGDEPRFYAVMAMAGFTGWDDERLRPWIARILPDGWFMAVHRASDQIVATAMCLHDHSELHPFGGELGWVAGDPAHAGHGLGRAVCAAVTGRFIAAGYHNIHLYTEDLAAGRAPHLSEAGLCAAALCARHARPLAGRLHPTRLALYAGQWREQSGQSAVA